MARSHMAHQLRSYRHTLLAVALLLVMPAVGQASDYWAPQGGENPPPAQEPVATSNPNDDRWNWYGSNYLYTADNPPAAAVPVPVPQQQFSNFFRGRNDRPWGGVPETPRGNWYDSGTSPSHNPWGGSSRQPVAQEPYRWDQSQGGEVAGRSDAGQVFGWDPYQPQQRPQPQPGADFPSSQQQYYGAPEQRSPSRDPYYQRQDNDRYRQPDYQDPQAGFSRDPRDQRDFGGYSRDPGDYSRDRDGYFRDPGYYSRDRDGYFRDPGYSRDRDGYRDGDGYARDEGYPRDRGGYQDDRERDPVAPYLDDPYYRYRDERRDDDRDRFLDPWTERNPMVNWWRNGGPMHWMDRRGEGW